MKSTRQDGTVEGAGRGRSSLIPARSRPEAARRIAEQLAARGFHFIDAPISGTSGMVARGDCLVMAGGSEEALETCLPPLKAIAKRVFHVGPSGAGSQMKLVHNHLIATMTTSIAEAFALGMKAGDGPRR